MSDYHYLDQALETIHPAWLPTLQQPELVPVLGDLDKRLNQRLSEGAVIYPPRADIFRSLQDVAPEQIRVVILGQDPYHGAGEAMGLSFSVPRGVRIPPSLRNIYKELSRDIGGPLPTHGDLTHWARQGVLLLNSVLTVEADQAGSHSKLNWQAVSQSIVDTVNRNNPGCVFMLWGNWARSNAGRIDRQRHLVLEAAHPSPLSASRGFFDCRHFSRANDWLRLKGISPVHWGEII